MPHKLNKSLKDKNEYKLSDGRPGRRGIQYEIEGEVIKGLEIPSYSKDQGWKLEKHSRENLLRLTPHTQKDRKLKILFITRKDYPDGSIILKAVLEDRTSGVFSLITSMNEEFSKKYNHSKGDTLDRSWSVCWTNMSAPAMFWEEFQNRLLY